MKLKANKLMKLKKLTAEHGQSLIEIVVSLGVIGILISAAVAAIAVSLRNSMDIKSIQTATSFGQSYADRIRAITESNWHTIYGISKGSANSYLIAASGTQSLVVAGEESVLENDVTSGLVGHWKFDESTGTSTYDFSGNGNQGVLTNGPTRTASSSCKAGKCLSFDGSNDYVVTPSSNAFAFGTGEFTIAGWFYLPQLPSPNYGVFKSSATTGGLSALIASDRFSFGRSLIDEVVKVYYTPPVNQWFYLAMTRSGTTGYVYLNGVLIGTGTSSSNYPAGNTIIGIDGNYASFPFNGKIDEFRIYNRALSASEITQLYSARVFTRKFYIDNANRDSCGSGNITVSATTSCIAGPGTSGVTDDPSTQKITVGVGWEGGRSISETQYVSRTRNKTFIQTNWSGGSGQTGTITESNNRFSTSTSINYTTSTGSIVIQGF